MFCPDSLCFPETESSVPEEKASIADVTLLVCAVYGIYIEVTWLRFINDWINKNKVEMKWIIPPDCIELLRRTWWCQKKERFSLCRLQNLMETNPSPEINHSYISLIQTKVRKSNVCVFTWFLRDDLLNALAPIQSSFPTGRLSGIRSSSWAKRSSSLLISEVLQKHQRTINTARFTAWRALMSSLRRLSACNY